MSISAVPIPATPKPLPTAVSPKPSERALLNASAFSTASPTDVASAMSAADALLGTKLVTAKFVDPTAATGEAESNALVGATALAPMADGAIFDRLPDAITVSQRSATALAGTVGDPGDQLAPGQIIVRVGDRYTALMAALDEAPGQPHPLIAQVESNSARSGWTTIAASSVRAVDPAVVAVIDGLGNVLPLAD